jgi:hypothetical protein
MHVVLELPDKLPLMLWEKIKKSMKNMRKMKKSEKWEKLKLLNKSYVCINKLLAREVHVISD